MNTGFFSVNEQVAVRQAIEAAEAVTSGEIAVIVTPESDRYREAELLGGILLGCLLSLITGFTLNHLTVWFFIPVLLLCSFPCTLLFRRFPRLKLPLIRRARLDHAVRERCLFAFYQKGLHRTSNETGVLIFISALERKVWIIGDRGINEKISSDVWQDFAHELSSGIRDRQACTSLCGIIQRCGKLLGEHFPRKQDDRNELTDNVILDKII